jgi:accessory gene regulator protein AgrB
MIPTYLLAMVLAIVAFWVFRQTAEDVYIVLAAAIAFICFIVGFAHAHWAAQILIALGLLWLDRRYRLGILVGQRDR